MAIENLQAAPRCQHIFSGNERCKAPAIRGFDFCHWHQSGRDALSQQQDFFPLLEDANSVQIHLSQVMRQLMSHEITPYHASVAFYGLQVAFQVQQKMSFHSEPEIAVTELTPAVEAERNQLLKNGSRSPLSDATNAVNGSRSASSDSLNTAYALPQAPVPPKAAPYSGPAVAVPAGNPSMPDRYVRLDGTPLTDEELEARGLPTSTLRGPQLSSSSDRPMKKPPTAADLENVDLDTCYYDGDPNQEPPEPIAITPEETAFAMDLLRVKEYEVAECLEECRVKNPGYYPIFIARLRKGAAARRAI